MHSKEKLIEYIQQSMHPAYQKATIDAMQPVLKINYKLNEIPKTGYSSLYYSQLELEGKLEKVAEIIVDEHIYFETLFDESAIQHHLFGDYQVVQNERIESDLEGHKFNLKKLTEKDLPALNASMDWILFLQLDADNALEVHFGDAGKMYFFIKKQDLLKGDFSKIKGYWDTH